MTGTENKSMNDIELQDLKDEWNALTRRRNSGTNIRFSTLHWEMIDDVTAVRPSDDIYCPYCRLFYGRDNRMMLRKSILGSSDELDNTNRVADQYYKCPTCDLVIPFGIPISKEHYDKISEMRARKGIGKCYAPVDMWQKDEQIKKRLKDIGYW